ncbi:hypothetical protein [Bdellovibrio sp. HCB288]|uniref:hypothetical protein n=1 Tax=Bdellovibrio sp. HCB288 TaxID=3394355 RepID=UPI0039B5C1A0
MDNPEKRTFFDTTDEFYFGRDDKNDLIQINFGPMRIQLSNYAAHDLAYRLSAFLLLLDGGEGSHPALKDSTPPVRREVTVPDNVLMLPRKREK